MSEEVLNNPIAEAYWREKIAKEIEADYTQQLADGLGHHFGLSEEFCYKQAAAIAKGIK